MKPVGLKEVKKAAKLAVKKQKIEKEIKELSKKYANLVNPNTVTEEYFEAMVADFIKQTSN